MELAKQLADAARGGIKAQRAIIDQHNRDAYDRTAPGSPRPAIARGTRDLRGEESARAQEEESRAWANIDAIARRAKEAVRAGMADPMPANVQRVFDGWRLREPREDEVSAVAERYGSNLQAARGCNAWFERIGSKLRVRHSLDAAADAIDKAASWAKTTVHYSVAGSAYYDHMDDELDASIAKCLQEGKVEGEFEVGEPENGTGFFNQAQRASRHES